MFYLSILRLHEYQTTGEVTGTVSVLGSGLQSICGCVAVSTLLGERLFFELLKSSGEKLNQSLNLSRLYGFSPIM